MFNKLKENIRSAQFLLRNQGVVRDFLKENRGQITLSDAPGAVLVIVLLGIILAVGNIILDQMKISSTSASANTTIDGAISGLTQIANFQGTIGTVIAAAVVIGLVLGALVIGGEARNRGGL